MAGKHDEQTTEKMYDYCVMMAPSVMAHIAKADRRVMLIDQIDIVHGTLAAFLESSAKLNERVNNHRITSDNVKGYIQRSLSNTLKMELRSMDKRGKREERWFWQMNSDLKQELAIKDDE
jgi:hypothetical protein